MQKRRLNRYCYAFLLLAFQWKAQVAITGGFFTYTQTFGSSGPASWTDNVSYLGWYQTSSSAYQGYINVTAAAPSNNGGVYTYQCAGNGDVKLGSRASGGSGVIRYGLRLRNTSGQTIQSINVAYDFFQMSLAQNGGNVNTIAFDYQVGATLTSLTTGAWTAVSALNFSALQSTITSGGSQILGYPCTQSGSKSAVCIPVTIPNNNDIMLRFTDVDDSGNDHHLAIDNVVVNTFTNNICSPLPVQLLSFTVTPDKENGRLATWSTISERNATLFEVEGANDAEHFHRIVSVPAKGESSSYNRYQTFIPETDWHPFTYFRLKQIDNDRSFLYSPIVYLGLNKVKTELNYRSAGEDGIPSLMIKGPANTPFKLAFYSTLGQLILHKTGIFTETEFEIISLENLPGGVYPVVLEAGSERITTRLLR